MNISDQRAIQNFLRHFHLTRDYWSSEINKSLSEEELDHFLIQMVVLWILQLNFCFNNDPDYFINKYSQVKDTKNGFGSMHDFLMHFLTSLVLHSNDTVFHDKTFGEIYFDSNFFIIQDIDKFHALDFPDRLFLELQEDPIPQSIPLFKTLSLLNEISKGLHSYIIAFLYENLVSSEEKKGSGLYYTPRNVSNYVVRSTIESWIVDNLEKDLSVEIHDLTRFIKNISLQTHFSSVFRLLTSIKLLDPAVGSGYFIESALNFLLEIYHQLWKVRSSNENIRLDSTGLDTSISSEFEYISSVTSNLLLSKNLFGVDINEFALKLTRARLVLYLTIKYGKNLLERSSFSEVILNFRHCDFLLDESPFDCKFNIIIVNPPYLGESGNKKLFRTLARRFSDYYEGKMDLWYFFL
ncbi:MAG: Eco57I restriction-modification methylase domain-containing protein, partial [Candidatus Hodarchaeales archaeon]